MGWVPDEVRRVKTMRSLKCEACFRRFASARYKTLTGTWWLCELCAEQLPSRQVIDFAE